MIAVTGLAGSGKDTLAEKISNKLGMPTYALACPIKELVHTLFEVLPTIYENRQMKEANMWLSVSADSLDKAAEVYTNIGLSGFEPFHDAWAVWLAELGLEYKNSEYKVYTSLRKLYQYFGTEWGRAIDELMWLKLAPKNHIITDVRMPNEAEFFLARGYDLIEVVRPNMEKIPESTHLSEQGIHPHKATHRMENSGTLEEMSDWVDWYYQDRVVRALKPLVK